MEILILVIALVAVYALKAASVLRWQGEETAKAASFSWTKPGEYDPEAIRSQVTLSQPAPKQAAVHAPAYTVRHRFA